MGKEHHYKASITWTGNKGSGTTGYKDYERTHVVSIKGKPDLSCSSDTAFMGDPTKHNPEDLLLTSLSACHMLWYLHLCADAGIVVTSYTDVATGVMIQTDAGGHFKEVTLHPVVEVKEKDMIKNALLMHDLANKHCFIANSCNFPVHHEPECTAG